MQPLHHDKSKSEEQIYKQVHVTEYSVITRESISWVCKWSCKLKQNHQFYTQSILLIQCINILYAYTSYVYDGAVDKQNSICHHYMMMCSLAVI